MNHTQASRVRSNGSEKNTGSLARASTSNSGSSRVPFVSLDKSAKPAVSLMQLVPFPSAPWEKIGIDIVGPFARAPQDCRFAISLVDHFSKWPEVGFTSNVTSASAMSFLRSIFSRDGYPKDTVSDHGPQFTSPEFEEFLHDRGIHHTFSAVYHPQSNGQVERFNRVLKDYIQVCLEEHRPLKEAITEYLGIYRCTPHATTGQKPAFSYTAVTQGPG